METEKPLEKGDTGGTEKRNSVVVGRVGWRNERIRLGPMSGRLADYFTRRKVKMNRVRISWKGMSKSNMWKEEYISPGDAIVITAADLEGGISGVSIKPRTETVELNIRNKKTFEEVITRGLKIDKDMTNNKRPILLKVEAFSKEANTKIAIVVKDAGYFPEVKIKERLEECLKEGAEYKGKLGEAEEVMKKVKGGGKARTVSTLDEMFEVERRIRIPQGMRIELEGEVATLTLTTIFRCKTCHGDYHRFENCKIANAEFIKAKEQVDQECKEIDEEEKRSKEKAEQEKREEEERERERQERERKTVEQKGKKERKGEEAQRRRSGEGEDQSKIEKRKERGESSAEEDEIYDGEYDDNYKENENENEKEDIQIMD